MWIDSHAHLYDLNDDDLAATLQSAREADVGVIITTATDCQTSRIVDHQSRQFPELWGAVGISPFDVSCLDASWREEVLSLLKSPRIVAVGETGIDSTNPRYPPMSLQQQFFEEQLEMARQNGLPAVIHSRGAEKRAVDICRDIGVRDALFHCFTGSRDALFSVLDNGYHVSISGIVTFKNSDMARLAPEIPIDRLLIETDTPYLAPTPHRGKRNCPAWVSVVGEKMAQLTGRSPKELQTHLESNFRSLFKKVT